MSFTGNLWVKQIIEQKPDSFGINYRGVSNKPPPLKEILGVVLAGVLIFLDFGVSNLGAGS